MGDQSVNPVNKLGSDMKAVPRPDNNHLNRSCQTLMMNEKNRFTLMSNLLVMVSLTAFALAVKCKSTFPTLSG